MYLPGYTGFWFAVARTPKRSSQWHTCKEYFGRDLGRRRPKNYVTVILWNGYHAQRDFNTVPRIDTRAKALEDTLNGKCEAYKTDQRFKVYPVKDQPGCLRIHVPPAWCANRVTAHLFATYVRQFLGGRDVDYSHLSSARTMLEHAQDVGLDEFNQEMAHIGVRYTLGIRDASHNWRNSAYARNTR